MINPFSHLRWLSPKRLFSKKSRPSWSSPRPPLRSDPFPRSCGDSPRLKDLKATSLGVVQPGEVAISSLLASCPHRCLFQGDAVEAWLIGLHGAAPPLKTIFKAALLLTVTFGAIDVVFGETTCHMVSGQSMLVPAATALTIETVAEADVMMLLTADMELSPPANEQGAP